MASSSVSLPSFRGLARESEGARRVQHCYAVEETTTSFKFNKSWYNEDS